MIRQYTDDSGGWNSGYNNRNYGGGDNGTENRSGGYYGIGSLTLFSS